jgi:hypothetical protein
LLIKPCPAIGQVSLNWRNRQLATDHAAGRSEDFVFGTRAESNSVSLALSPSAPFLSARSFASPLLIMHLCSWLLGAAVTFAAGARALPKVVRAGKYLYQEDGTRFFIKARPSPRPRVSCSQI